MEAYGRSRTASPRYRCHLSRGFGRAYHLAFRQCDTRPSVAAPAAINFVVKTEWHPLALSRGKIPTGSRSGSSWPEANRSNPTSTQRGIKARYFGCAAWSSPRVFMSGNSAPGASPPSWKVPNLARSCFAPLGRPCAENGGNDETRTRLGCRDRAVPRLFGFIP
jgi:hypothetical protein